jgi:hypothetical protein
MGHDHHRLVHNFLHNICHMKMKMMRLVLTRRGAAWGRKAGKKEYLV